MKNPSPQNSEASRGVFRLDEARGALFMGANSAIHGIIK